MQPTEIVFKPTLEWHLHFERNEVKYSVNIVNKVLRFCGNAECTSSCKNDGIFVSIHYTHIHVYVDLHTISRK